MPLSVIRFKLTPSVCHSVRVSHRNASLLFAVWLGSWWRWSSLMRMHLWSPDFVRIRIRELARRVNATLVLTHLRLGGEPLVAHRAHDPLPRRHLGVRGVPFRGSVLGVVVGPLEAFVWRRMFHGAARIPVPLRRLAPVLPAVLNSCLTSWPQRSVLLRSWRAVFVALLRCRRYTRGILSHPCGVILTRPVWRQHQLPVKWLVFVGWHVGTGLNLICYQWGFELGFEELGFEEGFPAPRSSPR